MRRLIELWQGQGREPTNRERAVICILILILFTIAGMSPGGRP